MEAFNKFFNSTFTVSDFVLPPILQMQMSPLKQLSQIIVSESHVFEALISLNPCNAQGCDNINSHILKYCCTSLTSSVTHHFSSMNQSHHFSSMNQSHSFCYVTPLPSQDYSTCWDLHPVSCQVSWNCMTMLFGRS